MKKSKEILYSKGKNDECYTPKYGVLPIIKYIPKEWTVWCPFDKEDSEFVKTFKMKFINNGIIENKITFSSSYFCYNFLPKQIIIEELKN